MKLLDSFLLLIVLVILLGSLLATPIIVLCSDSDPTEQQEYYLKAKESPSGKYLVEVFSHGSKIKSYESDKANGGITTDGGHTYTFPDGTTTHNHHISILIRPICGDCGKPINE